MVIESLSLVWFVGVVMEEIEGFGGFIICDDSV